MQPASIAVLSDLHIGRATRSQDLCPYTPIVYPSAWKTFKREFQLKEQGYLDSFLKFVKEKRIRPDYLLLAGDLTNEGQPDEVLLASRVVTDLLDAFHVPLERFFFVPGNHDSDWAVLDLHDSTGFRFNQRYSPLRNAATVFEDATNLYKGHMLEAPYFSIYETNNVLIAGYNSSWHDSREKELHHGLISMKHLDELRHVLPPERNALQVRIFALHHHIAAHKKANPADDTPDVSIAAHSEELLEFLEEFRFDILIHGHLHKPGFQTLIRSSGSPLGILGAGSFSCEPKREFNGQITNYFHVVEMLRRSGETMCLQGRVRSWAYQPAGQWIPASRNNTCTIDHVMPFGEYILPGELSKLVTPAIEAAFAGKNAVKWSEVIPSLPDYDMDCLPSDLVNTVLREVASSLGMEVHGAAPDDVILFRDEEGAND